ncbi:MAG: cell division protein FtsZ [Flavobacteriaceae bacterium]|nr:cell division protein FtsZ [Flavobacteriaceae bacterium]
MTILNNESGFTIDLPRGKSSIIKVIGVGGGGNNALRYMYEKGIQGVDFIVCNTDAQALDENPVSNKIQLGIRETEGLGAGADPEVGKRAAQESIDDIKAMLGTNTKMVFITAGMGGGTGTGAAPIIAKIAKDMDILTVGIVTVPFTFEGKRRLKQAEEGIEEMRANVDSLIIINNDKLRQLFGNLGFRSGFAKADEILTNAAKGMAEVITGYFDINIDFRDAKSVLQNSGTALMSEGIASGENRAEDAVKKALDSPLLNDNKITGAKNVLLLVRSGKNQEVSLEEYGLINDYIQREAGNTADIIAGVGEDENLEDSISVLVIATGFTAENKKNVITTEPTIVIDLDENNAKNQVYEENKSETTTEEEQEIQKEVFELIENEPQDTPKTQSAFEIIEEDNLNTSSLEDKENEEKSYDLFSYSEEEVESVSYTFDLNNESDNRDFDELKIEEAEPKTESFEIEQNTAPQIIEQKKDESPIISERRNKLSEFNSNFSSPENFAQKIEVPTFKRRN